MSAAPSSHPIVKQASAAYESGSYQKAARLYEEAAGVFIAEQNEAAAAEMRNNRSVALLKDGDANGALAAAEGTEMVFLQVNDPVRAAMAYGNQAAALEELGKLKPALALYEKSSELLKGTGNDELRVYVLQNISALQLKTGGHLQSMASMQAALDLKPRLSAKERLLNRLLKVPFRMLRISR